MRAIGAETWEMEDARDLVVPLMKRFGVQCILDVTNELVEVAVPSPGKAHIVRLSDEVRRYAVQLLGRMDTAPAVVTDAAITVACEPPTRRLERLNLVNGSIDKIAADYVPVDRKRPHVIERFANHLEFQSIPFHKAKDVELFLPANQRAVAFDFLIERRGERQIALVRRELSKNVRAQLVRLLKRLGSKYVGLRVWPIATEKSWLWEKEWISHEVSSPTASSEELVATPANNLRESASTETRQSQPMAQRDLF